MGGWVDGWKEGRTDGRTDGGREGGTDGRTDRMLLHVDPTFYIKVLMHHIHNNK